MNEWSVIVMLITLGGGIIALVRPIVTLTKAITELTVTCKNLDGQFAAMQNKTIFALFLLYGAVRYLL